MDLQKRLQDAINRGQQRPANQKSGTDGELSPEELKNLHNSFRLELSSYIEDVMNQIIDQLPGFDRETLFGEKGWGVAIYRDDLVLSKSVRRNDYSRLEIFVRPMNDYFVVELAAKATIRNKEVWKRSIYKPVTEAEMETFKEQINLWAVQYVELYAADQR